MSLAVLRRAAVGAAALALVAGAAAPAAAQRTFTSLTMFGDSFSDVGNARALFGAAVPARFSNGPVWSDYLSNALGFGTTAPAAFVPAAATGVYAVGGAVTSGGAVPSTELQIARWCQFNTTIPGACARGAEAGGLYTLFIGGNDVRGAAGLGTQAAREAATIAAANRVGDQAGQLLGLGARNLLLAYLPDLGLTPDRIGGPQSATLSGLTALFNQTLEARILGLRAAVPVANVFDLRLDNVFSNVLSQPGAFGFTNTTGSCQAQGALPACAGYVFADGLHPTTAAHALIASSAYQLVAFDRNVAVIPEPSTYALLGAGLLAVGGIAARRKRAA